MIGTDCIGSYKSNYHIIKATTAPKGESIYSWGEKVYKHYIMYMQVKIITRSE